MLTSHRVMDGAQQRTRSRQQWVDRGNEGEGGGGISLGERGEVRGLGRGGELRAVAPQLGVIKVRGISSFLRATCLSPTRVCVHVQAISIPNAVRATKTKDGGTMSPNGAFGCCQDCKQCDCTTQLFAGQSGG